VKHLNRAFNPEKDPFELGRDEVGKVVDAVFIVSTPEGTLAPGWTRERVAELCRRNRIPINVLDSPQLSTFSLLSVHNDGPLQIGVTTNGMGCKLASRIRRELASSLPKGLGQACERLGRVRRRIIEEGEVPEQGEGEGDDSLEQGRGLNRLVLEGSVEERKGRRMRFLAQVCEYWPLRKLAGVTEDEVRAVWEGYLRGEGQQNGTHKGQQNGAILREQQIRAQVDQNGSHTSQAQGLGLIILAGSGPGHPSLLTRATHTAILTADIILADKLVPSGVLDLIPRRTPVQIARKFPGNADAAQEEFLTLALSHLRQGKTVLRLKQGDPFIYGRGGEEVAFFREHGVPEEKIVVLPGVTSALSAPLFAGIPATQRDVADQVLICTGTGKKGKPPAPPEYVPSRTVVFLMALHRIEGLVAELTSPTAEELENGKGGNRAFWPINTPCAVIERASCPDQRVIRTTLKWVVQAIEVEGSRPPGLLVVGRACEALWTKGGKERSWVVEEGFRGLEWEGVERALEGLGE